MGIHSRRLYHLLCTFLLSLFSWYTTGLSYYPMCSPPSESWTPIGQIEADSSTVEICQRDCTSYPTTYCALKRNGPTAQYAECYCLEIPPESDVGVCDYYCGTYPEDTDECGGPDNKHSVYSVCPEGRFGFNCEYNCPDGHCADGVCHVTDVSCPAGCVAGYHGASCIEDCGECISGPCGQYDGVCDGGCRDGWYTPTCTETCPVNCYLDKCDIYSAACMYGCDVGWYTLTCAETCPVNCHLEACDIHDASCDNGCDFGWYTANCSRACSANCEGDPIACHRDSGECNDGCKSGWYTPQCTDPCPGMCNLTSCSFENGYCEDGCKDGYHGLRCEDSCPSNCSEEECTQDDGHCYSCRSGTFGELCDDACPANCADEVCDMFNGECENGCQPGWTGVICDAVAGSGGLSTPVIIGICVSMAVVVAGFIVVIVLLVLSVFYSNA